MIDRAYEWTVISDKQKGLIKAVEDKLPGVAHRFCVRHMHLNFRNAGFRDHAFKIAVWRAANATTVNNFTRRMEEIIQMDQGAFDWFEDKLPQQWSRSHFNPYPKCDLLMNNMCKSFNSKILRARALPILSMLEKIMNALMKRCTENRDRAAKWTGVLCPRIKKIIQFNLPKVADCMPLKADGFNYQISSFDGTQYAVDLAARTCACRKWDLTGIPCKHALCAISHKRDKPECYVHRCYMVETYQAVYGPAIMPINGRNEWHHVEAIPPLPPNSVRRVGRPPKARRREPDEPQQKHVTRRRVGQQTSMQTIKRGTRRPLNVAYVVCPGTIEGSALLMKRGRERKIEPRFKKYYKTADLKISMKKVCWVIGLMMTMMEITLREGMKGT